MLFSFILFLFKIILIRAVNTTADDIEAETVIPTLNPGEAFEALKIIAKIIPAITVNKIDSLSFFILFFNLKEIFSLLQKTIVEIKLKNE